MDLNPEVEDIATSSQGKAVSLISVGDGASQEAMAGLLSVLAKLETACTPAAQELETKLYSLAPIPSLS